MYTGNVRIRSALLLVACTSVIACVPEAPAPEPDLDRIIFVSSTTYTPDLINAGSGSALENADAICQELAGNASLGGTYKAILSDSVTNVIDRLSSLSSSISIELVDGTNIAMGSADLWDGNINSSINLTESGSVSGVNYWTSGSHYSGSKTGLASCLDWTTSLSTEFHYPGSMISINTAWPAAAKVGCNVPLSLACIEQ